MAYDNYYLHYTKAYYVHYYFLECRCFQNWIRNHSYQDIIAIGILNQIPASTYSDANFLGSPHPSYHQFLAHLP